MKASFPDNFKFLTIRNICIFYIAVCVVASLHRFWLGSYNNYLIFAEPFRCLLEGKTLYVLHPEYYDDLYKYSPTFAFLFFPKKIKFVLSMIFWTAVMFLLPALLIPFETLVSEYKDWIVVAAECKVGFQLSVMGLIQDWLKIENPFLASEIIGSFI